MKKSFGEKVFFRLLALAFVFTGCALMHKGYWYIAPVFFMLAINEAIAVNKEEE